MSNKNLKPIIILIALIALCAALSRTIGSGETLAQYAKKHPEKAHHVTTEVVTDGNADSQ